MEIIKLKDLKKVYLSGDREVCAVNHIDLSICEGKFIAITGTSGSGKTTLLNLIGGLDVPTSGCVIIKNNKLADLEEDELTIFRRRNVGFVFQNYNLIPVLNVYENVVFPLRLEKAPIDEKFLNNIMERLDIKEKMHQFPEELSGGQQQRVGIARALITRPVVILADEPTGNLDSKSGRAVIQLLREIASQLKQTVIIVTHDEKIAEDADQIVQIEDGKIKNIERVK